MSDYLEQLKKVPTSILSDVMNRMNCMDARIKPIRKNVNMVGTAYTVRSMVGGNWGTHKALTMIKENEVLVVDARGYINTSVWGFLQTTAAIKRKVAGVVIDGAIRDSTEIAKSDLPVFCKGIIPAGPHKNWKDDINIQIQCGGVVVNPGDYIKGDDDGVVVIPRNEIKKVLELSFEKLQQEKEWFERLGKGMNTFDIIGLKEN